MLKSAYTELPVTKSLRSCWNLTGRHLDCLIMVIGSLSSIYNHHHHTILIFNCHIFLILILIAAINLTTAVTMESSPCTLETRTRFWQQPTLSKPHIRKHRHHHDASSHLTKSVWEYVNLQDLNTN